MKYLQFIEIMSQDFDEIQSSFQSINQLKIDDAPVSFLSEIICCRSSLSEDEKVILIKKSLERGLCIEQTDAFDQTPLHYASLNNLPIVTSFLIEVGGQVDAVDKMGNTALSKVALRPNLKEVAKILIANGADIYHQNFIGGSAYFYMTQNLLSKKAWWSVIKSFETP